MSDTDRTDLMLEILKSLQGRFSRLEHQLAEVAAVQNIMRMDIHSLRSENLHELSLIAQLQTDVERIKTRLDLTDNLDA